MYEAVLVALFESAFLRNIRLVYFGFLRDDYYLLNLSEGIEKKLTFNKNILFYHANIFSIWHYGAIALRLLLIKTPKIQFLSVTEQQRCTNGWLDWIALRNLRLEVTNQNFRVLSNASNPYFRLSTIIRTQTFYWGRVTKASDLIADFQAKNCWAIEDINLS